jgi:hypothetical protein|tara:strand:+ start:1005 stop:1337 length:333 start_codon:yes stop_codon:yes gene_type:complete
MFKRWLILLVAILVLEFVVGSYFWGQIGDTFSDECWDYLNTLSDDWESASDQYFLSKCDYDNPVSDVSLAGKYRGFLENLVGKLVAAFMATFGLLIISFVGRWVYMGRIR